MFVEGVLLNERGIFFARISAQPHLGAGARELAGGRDLGCCALRPRGGFARHVCAKATIGDGVEQTVERGAFKMCRHARVGGEHRRKRTSFHNSRLGRIIDHIVRVLPAKGGGEL